MGIYPPEQIEEELHKMWELHNPSAAATVTGPLAQTIVSETVRVLGEMGNGIEFNEKTY